MVWVGEWSSSEERQNCRACTAAVVGLALVAAAIHLYQTATYALPSGQFKNLHVGLSLVVVFLSLAEKARNPAAQYLKVRSRCCASARSSTSICSSAHSFRPACSRRRPST